MSLANSVAAIIGATFDHMKRDRSTVVFLVLLPVGLMILIGNVYAAEDDNVPVLGIVDGEASLVTETITAAGSVDVETFADRDAIDDAVRRRTISAGVVVDGDVVTLVGAPDVQVPLGARFVVDGAVRRVDLARALTPTAGDVRATLAALPDPPEVPVADPGEARSEAAMGTLVLVTFMNLIAWSTLVVEHRQLGVLGRIRATGAGRGSVLVGYAAMFTAVAAVQVAAALAAGRVFVGIEWGPTVAVLLIGVALSIAAGGVATLAATVLPTPESGSSIGGPVGFALGMLGGCLWPLDFVGGFLASVGRFVPHFWAVDAFDEIGRAGWTFVNIAPQLLGLVATGVLGAAIGARRLSASW